MSERIAETAFWIRKRDKYHMWWECTNCNSRVLATAPWNEPPVTCPYCKRKTEIANEDKEESEQCL